MGSWLSFFQRVQRNVKRNCSPNNVSGTGGTGGGSPGGGSTGGGTGGGSQTNNPLGHGDNPYKITQDTDFAQTQLLELEKDLTKERLDEIENKSRAQNVELAKAFSTKSSKSLYQTEQISSLNWYVYYLIWIYAILAVVFLGYLFAGPKSKQISIYVKLLITLLLILYPYYITTIEDFLYEFVMFGSNILYGNVYLHPEY